MKQNYASGSAPSRTAASQRTVMGRLLLMTMLLFAFMGGARAQKALPYTYGFEDNNLATDGWELQGATSNSTGITIYAKQTGDYGFRFYYTEQSAFLLSPIFTGGEKGINVSFWYKEYSSDYGDEQFQVGYTTDETVTNATEFTYGDVVTASLDWQEYTNTFPAGTKRIAIKYIYGDHFYLCLDDFSFEINDGYARPTDLVASDVTNKTAVLSWTEKGSATAWVINVFNNDEEEGKDVNASTNPFTLTGLTPETEYKVRVRQAGDGNTKWSDEIYFTTDVACPAPTALAASDITTSSATISWTGTADSYNLRYKETIPTTATIILTAGDVWGDGSGYQMLLDADATAYGDVFDATGGWTASDYSAFEYTIPVNADCSADAANIVFNGSVSIQIPAGTYDWCIVNPSPGDKIYIAASNGNVGGRADDYVFEAGKTYEFVPAIFGNNDGVDVTITGGASSRALAPVFDEWVVVNNVTSPYTINDLNENAFHQVEVQGVYADGSSKWVGTNFTTLSSNPIPTNVVVTPAHTSATISWTGGSDSYEVKYRLPESKETFFFEDFESGIGSWTTSNLQSGGGIKDDGGVSGGAGFAFKWTSNYPQYLISPELNGINAGSTLSFYYSEESTQYPESFKVGYSTTTNDVEDAFTWSDETTVSSTSWQEYTQTLPAGVKYVAIQCTSDDKYYFYVDNIGIFGADIPAGKWTTISTNETSVEITGLEMDTEYEYQIFGIKNSTPNEGTAIASFTTLSAENDKIFTTAGDWDVASNWYPAGVPSATCKNATIKAAVTIPSGVVATAKNVTIDGGSITIKDGGQLIHNNEGVIATVEKNITGYGTSETGKYYLITAPLKNGIDPADVTNMLSGNYDLYAFDFTEDGAEWRNYKAEEFTLAQGNAYLYANSEDVTLLFTGELMPMPQSGYIAYNTGNYLSYETAAHPFKNWNLVGSTLVADAYITLGTYSNGVSLASNPEFYTINAAGDAIVVAPDEPTAVMGSVFVISQASNSITVVGGKQYQSNAAITDPLMTLPLHGLTENQNAYHEELELNFAKEGFATYYNGQFDVVLPEGMKARIVTSKDSENLTYETIAEGGESVPAATAVLLQIAPATQSSQQTVTLVKPTATAITSTNMLHGSDESALTEGGSTYYMLSYDKDGENIGWYWGAANGGAFTSGAHKAYLAVSGDGARSFLGLPGFEEETTGIVDNNRETTTNNDWYTVDGVKLNQQPGRKGLYIQNGNKVVIK